MRILATNNSDFQHFSFYFETHSLRVRKKTNFVADNVGTIDGGDLKSPRQSQHIENQCFATFFQFCYIGATSIVREDFFTR